MSLRTTLMTALAVGLLAPAAFAQTPSPQATPDQGARTPGIATRQRLQQARIRAAQKRGTLTAPEHRRLMAMERRIQALARQLRAADGKLTARERVQLQRELNRASRAIRRAGRG